MNKSEITMKSWSLHISHLLSWGVLDFFAKYSSPVSLLFLLCDGGSNETLEFVLNFLFFLCANPTSHTSNPDTLKLFSTCVQQWRVSCSYFNLRFYEFFFFFVLLVKYNVTNKRWHGWTDVLHQLEFTEMVTRWTDSVILFPSFFSLKLFLL